MKDSRRSELPRVVSLHRENGPQTWAFLDPVGETALQELVRLAARLAGMPYAGVALDAAPREWFKTVYGFDARRLAAGIGLCRPILHTRDGLFVEDARAVPEWAGLPGVASYPHLRGFAGVPLQNGHVQPLGSLFVASPDARRLTAEQAEILRILARQVVTQLELARKMADIHAAELSCMLAERRLRQQNRLLKLQQLIAVAANEASSAAAAIESGLTAVCTHTGWPVGHCYLLEPAADGQLVTAGLWHLNPPERYEPFRQETEALRFAAGCGLSGEVLTTGRHLCVDQLSRHPQFRRAAVAGRLGLCSGYFFPLIHAGQTIGTLEFFSDRPTQPNDQLLAVLDYVGNQLGQAVGRERAQCALREGERRLRDLFNSSPDAIFVEDLTGTVLDVSPQACALHQCDREWLIGKNVLDLVPASMRAQVEADFPRLARGEITYVESESLTASGQTVPVEIRASRIELAGLPALLLHVRDIRERRQLLQQFLQAQRTEAIGQLAGGVAHDFNNILTVITGYSELLLERPDLPEAVRRGLTEVKKAGLRGANLTRQLLAFSRKQVLQPQVLDLNVVVTDIEKMLHRLIGENIRLVTNLQPNLGHVRADPAQLEQVLMNLAVNARDAMPHGGSLVISTADIDLTPVAARRIGELPPGGYVVLSVTDTGCGMPPEVLERIFEPFFTTKPVGRGTGLGLATCYGIVKQSGGHIMVTSSPGNGTKFRIYLPRVGEATTPLPAPVVTGERPLGGTETILLAEDETDVRRLAAETLRALGYQVLEAGNGEEALMLAQEPQGERIDLLLTDVVMPQISGRELAEILQRSYPGIRVLFTSGYTNDHDQLPEILRQGVGFLEKPYTGSALARKVREVLDQGGENTGGNHGHDTDGG